jgi:menaquinone-dependent protoporphyrinogen oxidase
MSKKVLIAYGTRFGCTEEISEEIAKVLEKEGIEFQLLNLRKTKARKWPLVREFDGVLVGSGIKIMQWTKEPKTFLKKCKEELKEKVVGLFICSAYAIQDPEHAKKEYIEKVMEKVGVTADMYEAFGGVIDLSESSPLGVVDRKMLKLAAKGMTEDMGITIEDNAKNDFRDWDRIRQFAEKFAALVKG